jgi:hypothetical protein
LEQAGGGEQREVPLLSVPPILVPPISAPPMISVPPITEPAEAKNASEPMSTRGRKDKGFIWEPKGRGKREVRFC